MKNTMRYCSPSQSDSVCLCTCVCCVHTCVCWGQRSPSAVFPQEPLTLSLRWTPSLGRISHIRLKRADQWALGSTGLCSTSYPQSWDYQWIPDFFKKWFLDIDFRSLCCVISTLLTVGHLHSPLHTPPPKGGSFYFQQSPCGTRDTEENTLALSNSSLKGRRAHGCQKMAPQKCASEGLVPYAKTERLPLQQADPVSFRKSPCPTIFFIATQWHMKAHDKWLPNSGPQRGFTGWLLPSSLQKLESSWSRAQHIMFCPILATHVFNPLASIPNAEHKMKNSHSFPKSLWTIAIQVLNLEPRQSSRSLCKKTPSQEET